MFLKQNELITTHSKMFDRIEGKIIELELNLTGDRIMDFLQKNKNKIQLDKDEISEKKTKTLIINNNYNTEVIIPADTKNILIPQKNMFIKNYLNSDSFSIENIDNNKEKEELENYKQEKTKIKGKINKNLLEINNNEEVIPGDNSSENNKKIDVKDNISEYKKQKEIIPNNNLLENKKANVNNNISEYEKQKEIFLKNIMDSGERLSRINRKEINIQSGMVKSIIQSNVLSKTILQDNLFKDQIKINAENCDNLKVGEENYNDNLGKTIMPDKINNNIVNLNNENNKEIKIVLDAQNIDKNTFINEIEDKMTDCLILHQGKFLNLLNPQLDNSAENHNEKNKPINKETNRINKSTKLIKEQNIKTNIQLFDNNDIYEYPDTKKR